MPGAALLARMCVSVYVFTPIHLLDGLILIYYILALVCVASSVFAICCDNTVLTELIADMRERYFSGVCSDRL